MANEFMKSWNPEKVKKFGPDIVLEDGTSIDISEGDTIFIKQENWRPDAQHVALDRHQLYNLVFNFMSAEELVEIANRKINPDYKLLIKAK